MVKLGSTVNLVQALLYFCSGVALEKTRDDIQTSGRPQSILHGRLSHYSLSFQIIEIEFKVPGISSEEAGTQ